MAAAVSEHRLSEITVRKAVRALITWKKQPKPDEMISHHKEEEVEFEAEEFGINDFIYLSVTLNKKPPRDLTLSAIRIPLRHSLLPQDYSILKACLIIDGKKITSQTALKALKPQILPFPLDVLKLSKLKSNFKSFDSKKKLYDSYDIFFAAKNVVSLLPNVLGKVFYRKKKKIPFPVELKADCSNLKDEIDIASRSSLLCLGTGTCSLLRVGKFGFTNGEEIVENVFKAVDGILEIVPKKWNGIRCFHLKFSDSLALPVYEFQPELLVSGQKRKRV